MMIVVVVQDGGSIFKALNVTWKQVFLGGVKRMSSEENMAPSPARAAAAPQGVVVAVAPAGSLQVAAFGDSLMWGQGNRRQERFSALFTGGLQARVGQPGVLVWDSSRSGAKIRALPGEQESFVDAYPFLFPDAATRRAFLDGRDESRALGLYGEVPATFPTVLGQVNMMPAATGRQIDIALVDGGVNDIAIEDIINPQIATGKWIERYDGQIRHVVDDNVTTLLRAVRAKCPNAVILYFGFFAGVSYQSSTDKIRAFFEHEFNDDFKWWFNQHIYTVTDVNDLINEGQTRGEWFLGRWQYWTRQAVNALSSSDAQRGPGIVYVPSGIRAIHAAFTTVSRIWEDYELPTSDPATADRLRGIPRQGEAGRMAQMYQQAVLRGAIGSLSEADRRQMARDLDARINGPTSLKRNLQAYAAAQGGETTTRALIRGLAEEIYRIQHGMIASLGHPNTVGAASYARSATNRYAEHLQRMDRVLAENRAGIGGPVAAPVGEPPANTLDTLMRRYNMRGDGALAGAVPNLDVDSIALIIRTAATSSTPMILPAFLVLGRVGGGVLINELLTFQPYRRFEFPEDVVILDKRYPYLDPGQTNRLTLAVFGVQLEEIASAALVLGPDPGQITSGGRSWTPASIELEVNGWRVHTVAIPAGTRLGPGGHLDLGWPGPAPDFQPPPVVLEAIRRVPPLAPINNTATTAGNPPPPT